MDLFTWKYPDLVQASYRLHLVVGCSSILAGRSSRAEAHLAFFFPPLCSILIHLLVKFPTTSYFYPFSPGFRWVSSKPSSSSPTTPSSSEAQPTPSPSLGRWRFSFAGLPSDPHPLSGDKPKSFFPYWWPILITEFPFVLCWVACITGSIGEFGDESYSRFLYWVYGVSMVCFPYVYYLARDGGALDIHGKKDQMMGRGKEKEGWEKGRRTT